MGRGREMKELIDFKIASDWFMTKWRTPAGAASFVVVSFVAGMAMQNKFIVDDCKFMGAFRDGAYSYNCSVRPR